MMILDNQVPLYWMALQDIINQSMLEQASREKELDYNRFCSYPIADILGVCIESEYLYIVQQHKISVYEYHGKADKPQLSEELIHNEIIKNYCINRYYICIRSSSLIEVRDRKHWENVLYSYPLNDNPQDRQMILDGHSLYISQREGSNLLFDKIEIDAKEITSAINLGKVSEESLEILKTIKPMFLNQLGMLNDFYIWTKSSKTVQLGMLYTNQGVSKRKFEINQIELNEGLIRNVYHHRVNCLKYPNQSPQYVVIIAEKVEDKQLYLHLYEIVSRDHSQKKEETDLTEFQGKFQGILNQFSFLKNLHQGPTTNNSLVQEVFNEAIASDTHQNPQKAFFEVKLEGMKGFQSSYACQGKLWVVSNDKICEIELTGQQSIQNIVKSYRSEQKVVRSISYQEKSRSKRFIGVYKQKILLSEATTSFDIAYVREGSDEIAEEIEEYEINDEILEKEGEIKINAEAEKLRQDFLRLRLQQNEKDLEEKMEKKQPIFVVSDCFSQTELEECKTQQYGTQTVNVDEKPAPLGLMEIQELVAKYSSQVSVSCTKVKQNNYIKDKFDRQIFNIVDKVVKENVQPFLQSKFLSNLEGKIKEISQHITTVFETQLEGLNEYMRKNETKENNLRGRRIFQFSNQVNSIKDTVSIISDSLKANEIHKHAFNELILEEAKEMKEEINKISNSITQLQTKNEATQKEISDQITQILQLVKTLQENRKENLEDSSCEAEECGEESVQREVVETSEQQDFSQDSDEEVQREEVHHRYPQYRHYASRGVQEHKRNKKSFDPLENKGYSPYPAHDFYHAPPTQMPYYYPFMPHIPSLPMQGYYPPNFSYPFPQHTPNEEIQKKKVKTSKKVKKSD